MTGSDRNTSSADTFLRAPYAAPRDPHRVAGRTTPVASRAAGAVLAPFVPREFRDTVRDVVPEHSAAHATTNAVFIPAANAVAPMGADVHAPAADASAHSGTDSSAHSGAVESLFAVPVPAHESKASAFSPFEETLPADLPWIDAYAADEPDAEDEWPMGEAGKRLDELTQSLTSIDASRARQEARDAAGANPEGDNSPGAQPAGTQAAGNPEHAMWGEDEWIDIMPTPLPSHTGVAFNTPVSSETSVDAPPVVVSATFERADPSNSTLPQPAAASVPGIESAARALEGLAQRVRTGQVQVPAFNADVADEAVLAALLASMLGWRQ